MANGTILNGIFASRIHKSNADQVLADAEKMLQHYKARLLVLAASTPRSVDEGDGPVDWCWYVQKEIDDITDKMEEDWWNAWVSSYIKECPDECKDELVEADWDNSESEGSE